jgi:hypothetical protein
MAAFASAYGSDGQMPGRPPTVSAVPITPW